MIVLLNRIAGFVPSLVWVAAALAMMTFGLFQSWRLDSANQKLGAAQVAVDAAVSANRHNGATIEELRVINTSCVDGRRLDEERFEETAQQWAIRQIELEALSASVRREEIEIYREPDCREFAQLDITAVCPQLAVQWRERLAP